MACCRDIRIEKIFIFLVTGIISLALPLQKYRLYR
jgi:hypothetical protein